MADEQIREDIGRLTAATEALAVSMDGLRTELRSLESTVATNGQSLASMEARLTETCAQCGEMRKSIMQGNGQPALLSRVQRNADSVKMLDRRTAAIVGRCDQQSATTILSRNQITVAIIGLMGALVASCASLVVTLLRQ